MKKTKKELQTILKSINEMITIPMFNKFNLSKDELKEMRKQIKLEIDKLDNKQLIQNHSKFHMTLGIVKVMSYIC